MMNKKEKWLYPFYVIFHPFDGFYEVRHRGKGSVPIALLMVFLFGLSFSLNRKYASFVVNYNNPLYEDSLRRVINTFIAVFVFATANWSITCLMEGEGRFKDIITVIGYSMLPMVLTFVPATVISWFIANDEEGIYTILVSVSIIYFVILFLIGIMVIHNFGFGKTLVTIVLTFIAMVIIIFLLMLLSTIVGYIRGFIESMYNELILRV